MDNSKEGYEIKTPILLTAPKGGFDSYQFEIEIISDTTNLYFRPVIRDELSLKHQNAVFNGIMISDRLIAE